MKKLVSTLLTGLLLFAAGCTKEETAKADGRLLGLELSFHHTDPKTGETVTNEFSNYYRKTDQVEVSLESSLDIEIRSF